MNIAVLPSMGETRCGAWDAKDRSGALEHDAGQSGEWVGGPIDMHQINPALGRAFDGRDRSGDHSWPYMVAWISPDGNSAEWGALDFITLHVTTRRGGPQPPVLAGRF